MPAAPSLKKGFKTALMQAHRWIGLILFPVFAVILVSGAILAFKPISAELSQQAVMEQRQNFNPQLLAQRLSALDSDGRAIMAMVSTDGMTVTIKGGQSPGTFNIVSGEAVADKPASSFGLFEVAKQAHISLFTGIDDISEIASYFMIGIMIAGLFLAWPRFRNTMMGWHTVLGFFLLPALIIIPLSGLLFDVGKPEGPKNLQPPLSLSNAVTQAAGTIDLNGITMVRQRKGTTFVQVAGPEGGTFQVSRNGVGPAPSHGIFKQIHEGIWAGMWSGLLNLTGAIVLFILSLTGFLSWFRRARLSRRSAISSGGSGILVSYASQTGTAAKLAEATAQAMRSAGKSVSVAALAALNPPMMAGFKENLVFVSTTGDGDLPDQARPFVRALRPGALNGTRVSLFALGDSRYENFCGGGYSLRQAMLQAGATEAIEFTKADGDPKPVWRRWLESLACDLGTEAVEAPEIDTADSIATTLFLCECVRLDSPDAHADGQDTNETWSIVLTATQDLAFRPGDLLLVAPKNDPRPRSYSIGSSSLIDPRRIELTVTRHTWTDEAGIVRDGRMSTFLCRELAIGGRIDAQIRRNPGFNPPDSTTTPVILIGAGCGIAPFPGFIEERASLQNAGPVWLLFGNRRKVCDFLHRERIGHWLESGALHRFDAAFSRDAENAARIDRLLIENGRDVKQWLMDENGVLYLCGRKAMLDTVSATLRTILAAHTGMNDEAAQGMIEAWLAQGKIRTDLFD